MVYQFKSQAEDFFVSELLDFEPKGEWDFLYIFFEKKELNTMDILWDICHKTQLPRKAFGIAGLKDKVGITQQRISIHKRDLAQLWWEEKFTQLIQQHGKILTKNRHTELLRIWANIWNRFTLKLRSCEWQDTDQTNKLKKKLEMLWDSFQIPNFFGIQRFGKGMRNFKRARKIFESWTLDMNKHMKFNLQAYASYYFNQYLHKRLEQNLHYLDGDILSNHHHISKAQAAVKTWDKLYPFDYFALKSDNENKAFIAATMRWTEDKFDPQIWTATGPMIWYNLVLPPVWTPAYEQERNILKDSLFVPSWEDLFHQVGVYGIRRPLWSKVSNFGYYFEKENDNLILSFSLPTGSYATVLLRWIFCDIDQETCTKNHRDIKY